ncbi:hypothetical protein [Natronoglomus mannanivorans]|uniref:Uncharacterized protein n=1 Tax=Natronoglomus mannanivorans TaxID=2979990 RepID=A0AAP2Z464_9EURY|nr:hypothetical protein [Halobacteria archaeon AArc-xg1-1]
MASVVGMGLLLVYPSVPVETIPGSDPIHPAGALESSHPLVVYLSAVSGPVVLVWGMFVFRYQNLTPLTPGRALLAPVLSVLGIVAGIGRFTYEWIQATPFDAVHRFERDGTVEAETIDPSVLEIVLRELTGVQFVALAAVSAIVVGAVAARHSWRDATVVALLPIGFVAVSLADVWDFDATLPTVLLGTTALASIPFAVGYVATRPEDHEGL